MTEILPLFDYPRIRGGLETVLAPLIGRDGQDLTENEWSKGVLWTNISAGETFVSGFGGGSWGDPLEDEENRKPINSDGGSQEFMPVSLGAIYGCEMQAPGGTQGDVSAQRAESLLRRRTYSDLARLLYTGENYRCADDTQNPGFISEGFVADGGDVAGSIRGVFHGLLDSVCATWDTEPVFFIPLAFMPHFLGHLVQWDEATGTYRMGPYRVSFDCYPNEGPTGSTPAATDGSEVWVYAALPPRAAVSENIEIVTVRTNERNQYRVRAEREAIIGFDAANIVAAKASVS